MTDLTEYAKARAEQAHPFDRNFNHDYFHEYTERYRIGHKVGILDLAARLQEDDVTTAAADALVSFPRTSTDFPRSVVKTIISAALSHIANEGSTK